MEKLEKLRQEFDRRLNEIRDAKSLQEARNVFLGRNSRIMEIMATLKDLPEDKRKEFGAKINELRADFTAYLAKKQAAITATDMRDRLQAETLDCTMPGFNYQPGCQNPYWLIRDEMIEILVQMGYEVYEGSEVETDYYNFTALNTPNDHPARDMQDSFYLDNETLLRSHTSAAQAHKLQDNPNKLIKIITPGKTYRRDSDDATHSHQFAQIECLVIGKDVHMGHLKSTLRTFLNRLFHQDGEIRMRSSYFPFTEPSVEVDMTCVKCGGAGCSMCKGTGFIEILGAGMVHPNVLSIAGFDAEEYQGFAFGIGIERVALLKYGIDDIRRIYQNDRRFIHQFTAKTGE